MRHEPQQSCSLFLVPGCFAPECCTLTTPHRIQIWSQPLMVTRRDECMCPCLRRNYKRGDYRNKQRTAMEIRFGNKTDILLSIPSGTEGSQSVPGAVAEMDLEPAVPSAGNTLSCQTPCSSLPSSCFSSNVT